MKTARDVTARQMIVPAGLSVVFAGAFCWPLFEHIGELGVGFDWDQHQLYHWVPYETVRSFGEIPLWNPFECGGKALLAHPQSRLLSPFLSLHLRLRSPLAMLAGII